MCQLTHHFIFYVYEIPCGHALAYKVAIFVYLFIKAHFSAYANAY